MATLFASDLHLDSETPWAIDAFLAFLAGPARQAEALYLLGDIFEVWVGDDDDNADNARTCDALAALTSTLSGLLQTIPFFGPFISWAPPVITALLFKPEALIPTTIIMVIGWFLVMNVLQPRIMQNSVGIHPIVVLMSVLIGSRIAGIPGAIFGIPVAAVLSSFFFFYLHRSSGDRTVAGQAAKRVSEREGRPVKPPREPAPGQASDVESV